MTADQPCSLVHTGSTRWRGLGRRAALVGAVALTGCLNEDLIKQPELTVVPGAPAGWSGTSNVAGIGITLDNARTGSSAAYLSNAFQVAFGSFRLVQSVRADAYRGKRVRLSAWVRPRNVGAAVSSGIWMRVDGPGITLGLDEMSRRVIAGFGAWREVSVVLDVPERAVGISFGAVFQATNTLLVDDMRFEVVSNDVASTNILSAPINSGLDSLATVEAYARSPLAPVNLDFEGLTPVGSAATTFVAQNSAPLSASDPAAALDDLTPFRTIVGTAQLVGLGEATYGTREFMQMKHRLVRYMVTQMGFTTIAIEAPAAEVADLNLYINGGAGNPTRLLSRLYSWTTNTQEIADLITWLRAWNQTASASQRVRLRGIDMVAPGASMDSVTSFVHRVAPAFDVDIQVWYQCLTVFRNQGATAGRPRTEYAALPADSRGLCAEGVNDVVNLVNARGAAAPDFADAVGHAALVKQFEAIAGIANAAASSRLRDSALANNVITIREQAGTQGRVIVWAHNDRITRQPGAMGAWLHARYGDAYRPIGFAFASGRFQALLGQGASTGALQVHTVVAPPERSIEATFSATNGVRLLFDTRRIITGGADVASLRGPLIMRTIGLAFNPNTLSAYSVSRLFPEDFDGLVFIKEITESTLLPFVN